MRCICFCPETNIPSSQQAANELKDPAVAEYFAQCIMKCVPKSRAQALGEVSGRAPIRLDRSFPSIHSYLSFSKP